MAEAHAGALDNLAYAAVPDDTIRAMVRSVAANRPDAVTTYCTNLPAAHLVAALDAELDMLIYDSVSAGVWGALGLAHAPTQHGLRWGRLFEHGQANRPVR